jgi:imidazolonepropionase-like amidohydrolase
VHRARAAPRRADPATAGHEGDLAQPSGFEALKLVTHDNAQLLALAGPRNPYPGKLGVVQEGALADLLLVDGNPLETLDLVGDPERNFVVIMKDGKVHKNSLPR